MKTKSLLLTALLSLAGCAGLMAQSTNVYSLNIVGYVNTTIPHGFTLIANPLNGAGGTNTVGSVLPAPPDGTVLYLYNDSTHGYDVATFATDDFGVLVWDYPGLTFKPGMGAWIYNPSSSYTSTFVGEVPVGTLTNTVPHGYSLRSSIVPQAGQLDTQLGYTPTDGDTVYIWQGGQYAVSTFATDDFGVLSWDYPPVATVGNSFWLYNAGAQKNWVRTFTVN